MESDWIGSRFILQGGKPLRTVLLRRHPELVVERVRRHDITEADERWISECAAHVVSDFDMMCTP